MIRSTLLCSEALKLSVMGLTSEPAFMQKYVEQLFGLLWKSGFLARRRCVSSDSNCLGTNG